jgi:hypothetical protein
MGCKKCDEFEKTGNAYYFRVGKANISIICCEEHFKEVREKLL